MLREPTPGIIAKGENSLQAEQSLQIVWPADTKWRAAKEVTLSASHEESSQLRREEKKIYRKCSAKVDRRVQNGRKARVVGHLSGKKNCGK